MVGKKLLVSIITAGAIVSAAVMFSLMPNNPVQVDTAHPQEEKKGMLPKLHDDALKIELVTEGLEFPTSMRFLDDNDILVLQKDDGKVLLVSGGQLHNQTVLQVRVANEAERGLLGVAIWNKGSSPNYDTEVFLYFTEIIEPSDDGNLRNRVYKYSYDWNEKILANQTLILDLPGEPGPFHNGGKIAIGPYDGYLYAVIGDVNAGGGMLDNEISGRDPDDKSVILRVDKETGLPAESNPFYDSKMEKLKRYYAYGIRNGFGMDFDPVSHNLWITENGPDTYDEINIIRPGFNSGWHKVVGPISRNNVTMDELVIFDGAKYEDPVFSWYTPIGVTDIEFFDSEKLGEKYENNVFVGDINNGNLYFFEVNEERTGLVFQDSRLSDLVADPVQDDESPEITSILLGEGFERITDIETGPDGFLYILTYDDGKIYRIVNNSGG